MGDLSSLLGGIDPGMIAKLLPVLSQLNRPESGETAAFLRALRPFLKPERQDKVERAAQLARVIHLGKTLLLSEGGPRNVKPLSAQRRRRLHPHADAGRAARRTAA